MNTLLAGFSTSITELKRNPNKVLESADGNPVVVLNHNKPMAYLIPAEAYEHMMDLLEDAELGKIIKAREPEKTKAVEVSLNEL